MTGWQVACAGGVVGLSTLLFFFLLGTQSFEARRSRPRLYAVPRPSSNAAEPCTTANLDTSGRNSSPKSFVSLSSAAAAAAAAAPIQCYAPATGQFLGSVKACTTDDIDRSIAAAAAAQVAWAQTSLGERKAVLRSLLRHVLDHAEDICRVACLDSGKTMLDAQLGEILVTAEKLQWTLSHGERALRPSRRPTNLLMAHKANTVRYEPLGVVAALVSWNYPFHNMMGPVVAALFTGNAVVVKVSEQTAWSSAWSSRAGPTRRATSRPLVAELGGKDAFLVLDSAPPADVPRIVEIILRGTFQAAGQNCIGIERVVAAGARYDHLVALLEPRVRALRLGPDADVGALISDSSFARLENLVRDAVSRGARLLAGGRRFRHPDFPNGHYFQPTMLVDVTPDMAIAQQECFAPILTMMRARSSSAEDMLAVANAPDFGLGASVHGSERDPAMADIVRGLRVGMVAVNDFAAYYAVQLPFGGVAGSGYGRFAGEEGLRGLCNLKSVCQDRFACLGVRTHIPPPVRYPVANQQKSWTFAQGVVEVGYGQGVRKVRGLGKILANM
ncbi:Aldehyde/histidinol dehydrogenase [Moelleriella libera RCEF 2490]|uniref:aldehyde dehydrogenase (NAD(+)) n=1 Tax=Moelleriella libera RCEF 2490 TaxID=1081109 RepID=A0A167ZYQ9_9HYPO|nr:Aldehyde/histidinol dehydrogenase [Moelleriella libera RCEF 2490]